MFKKAIMETNDNIRQHLLMIFVLLTFISTNSSAAFIESFDIDTATTLETQNTYPSFSYNISGSAIVSSGILQLESAGDGSDDSMTILGSPGDVIVSVDIGLSTSSIGLSNVGLMIGENYMLFHPGFGGGAFRIIGPGGGGNINMGFTPALDVLHHMQVHVQPSGLFEIQVTDANNLSNVFNTTFTNLASVGGDITLQRQGTAGQTHRGLYDNLSIIPVPASVWLFGFGLIGLTGIARRKKG